MENERENYGENYMEAWRICRGSQEYELLSYSVYQVAIVPFGSLVYSLI